MFADRFPNTAQRPDERQASQPATRPQVGWIPERSKESETALQIHRKIAAARPVMNKTPTAATPRTPEEAAAIRRAAAAVVAQDAAEMLDNAFNDLFDEPQESSDGHGWMCSGLGDDQADEIRDLCNRAGMPELAEGFILDNLSTSDVQLRLIEALAAANA